MGDTHWPQVGSLHPVVAGMGPSDEPSIEAVARYIASREPEPFARVKALHDWVVDRLHYDQDSLDPARRKPQDAASVFAGRTGVCEGYARLLVELGQFTGDRIVLVVGEVREESGEAAPIGHAWNAVELRGKWYLMDATWDDPVMKQGEAYRTDYLFIPPSVALFDHFPEDPRWQLLASPISRGEFLRQPLARPGFAKEGLTLVSPERSTVEVTEGFELRLLNPRRLHVSLELSAQDAAEGIRCGVQDGVQVQLRCEVPGPGRYQAKIFTNRERYGVYGYVAAIAVIRR